MKHSPVRWHEKYDTTIVAFNNIVGVKEFCNDCSCIVVTSLLQLSLDARSYENWAFEMQNIHDMYGVDCIYVLFKSWLHAIIIITLVSGFRNLVRVKFLIKGNRSKGVSKNMVIFRYTALNHRVVIEVMKKRWGRFPK